MHPVVIGLMAAQHGLLTRSQALGAGVTAREVDKLVRTGAWVAVRRGVYATREWWDSQGSYQERARAEVRSASLRIRHPHVLSHHSAALFLEMPVLRQRPPFIHVTRARVTGSRNDHGVKHHLAPYRADQVREVDGMRVLDPARTAVDIARECGRTAGVAAMDAALRVGVTIGDLGAAVAPMKSWANVTRVRAALDLADAGSESLGETLARLLVLELGIGRPETQFGLRHEGREAFCDLRVGRHVFEFDGRIKYRLAADGGVAVGPGDQVLWEEKQRQDWVCGFKLGMSRIVWDDFWGFRRDQALRRLHREYTDTVTRFGDSIDDLAPYRASRRRA